MEFLKSLDMRNKNINRIEDKKLKLSIYPVKNVLDQNYLTSAVAEGYLKFNQDVKDVFVEGVNHWKI